MLRNTGGFPLIPQPSDEKSSLIQVYDDDVTHRVENSTDSSSSFTLQGNYTYRSVLCVTGGILFNLQMGVMNCWGNFITYSPPSLRFFDGVYRPDVPPDALIAISFTLLSMCLALPFGSIITKKLGARVSVLLGGLIASTSMLISAYTNSLFYFIISFSILHGIGLGIGYTAPMEASWKWYPQSKGFVTGAIQSGYGCGGLALNLLGSYIVNPSNISAINGLFPDEIYDRFPILLRFLSFLFLVNTIICYLFITEPRISIRVESKKPEEPPGLDVSEAIQSIQFMIIWSMVFCSACAGLNAAALYKQFAIAHVNLTSDRFHAVVGAAGALFNALGRLFWGSLCDQWGYAKTFVVLATFQAILHFIYPFSAIGKPAFCIAHSLSHLCLGGIFTIFPPATVKLFGTKKGTAIYGLIFSAFGIASVGGILIAKSLLMAVGWRGVFSLCGTFSLIAAMLSSHIKPIDSIPLSSF